jgi:hypothetical protein
MTLSITILSICIECHYAECCSCHAERHYAECRYADCCYAECRYAESHGASKTVLNWRTETFSGGGKRERKKATDTGALEPILQNS